MPRQPKPPPDGQKKPPPKRGRGRPPKLTPELLKALGDAIRTGAPIRQACQSEGINRDSYYAWKARGDADRATGRRSIYAEFSDTVRICEAKGEVGYWATVARGAKSGTREHVAAGKLALNALRTRWGKRYHHDAGRGRGAAPDEGGDDGKPETPAKPVDWSKLDRAELAELRRLLAKARGG